jgi:hypothetical protein
MKRRIEDLPMPLSGFTYVVNPGTIENVNLDALRSYWREKRNGRELPSRADIDPLELKQHLGNLYLIDVFPDHADFRYRLLGTRITERYGRDSTGKTVSEVYRRTDPATCEWLIALYATVARARVPVRASAPLRAVNKEHLSFDAIYLPLSGDGKTVDMILGEVLFFTPPRPVNF